MNKIICGMYPKKSTSIYKLPMALFSTRPLSMSDKLRMIKDKEEKYLKENKEEIAKKEIKLLPALLKLQKMRGVIYLTIPFLIWTSPFSILYSKLLLFSNYYLIFLSTLEATSFFSLALNQHSLEVSFNHNSKLKSAVTRKRLMLMIIFFTFLMLAAYLASEFKNSPSLGMITMLNLYLFTKFSYHITLYNLDKLIFNQKMKNVSMNIIVSLLILILNIKKTNEINNNILY